MGLPDVAVHVAVGGELHAAILALVGLDPHVDVDVHLHVLLEGEPLGADVTLVGAQVLGRVLGDLVVLQVALVAHELALVALVLGADAGVLVQGVLVLERLATLVARDIVRAVAGLLVLLQPNLLHRLAALVTASKE